LLPAANPVARQQEPHPTVLHWLNDWILTGPDARSEWVWNGIQAFLFPGCTASAAIGLQMRHTPIFRGESLLLETSWREHAVPGS
jgi:hypothetical protein